LWTSLELIGWLAATTQRYQVTLHKQIQLKQSQYLAKNTRRSRIATLEWVDWFNNRRLLEPICNIPTAELEKRYYEHIEGSTMVS